MGTRTMGSHGGAGGGGGGGNGGTQHPKLDGLSKQGLLYNLTLDEVEHQLGDLGKPLSSMNLDELLKSVWSVEANEGMRRGVWQLGYSRETHLASASSMPSQSGLDLARDLRNKTVDELWQDMQRGRKKKDNGGSSDKNGSSDCNLDRKMGEKQASLGEMTLEDFLAKAGIVDKSSPGKKNVGCVVGDDLIALSQQSVDSQQAQWMQYQIPQIQQQQHVFVPGHHQVQQPLPSIGNQIMDATYAETQMTMSSSSLMGNLSDTQTSGRKRVASGDVMEKTVERRQKRMIKNRESAARSRARKQAYTHELENKVSRLEEENERLKREKEAEKVTPCVPLPEPKYQLRRTSSALF